jgi:hypothetical protein
VVLIERTGWASVEEKSRGQMWMEVEAELIGPIRTRETSESLHCYSFVR